MAWKAGRGPGLCVSELCFYLSIGKYAVCLYFLLALKKPDELNSKNCSKACRDSNLALTGHMCLLWCFKKYFEREFFVGQCHNDFLVLRRDLKLSWGHWAQHYCNINNIKGFNKHKVVNPTLLKDWSALIMMYAN